MQKPAADVYELAQLQILQALEIGSPGLSLSPQKLTFDGASYKGDARFKELTSLPPEIGELRELRALRLSNSGISEITPLERLLSLEKLNLDNTQIGDLTPLAALDQLQELRIRNVPALTSDPELSTLSKIKNMRQRTHEVLAYLRGETAPAPDREAHPRHDASDFRVRAVHALQREMANLGLNVGSADGIPGPLLDAALAEIEFPDAPDIERMVSQQFPNMSSQEVYDVAEILDGQQGSPTLTIKPDVAAAVTEADEMIISLEPDEYVTAAEKIWPDSPEMARLEADRLRKEGLELGAKPEAPEPEPSTEEMKAPALQHRDGTAPFYPDQPAIEDLLNRKAVAETLGTIIDQVLRDHDAARDDNSFIAHLHGRWGSGKTSILNFLREVLLSGDIARHEPTDRFEDPPTDPPWVIVDYNAWRNQNLGPAWWTLMDSVYRQSVNQLGDWSTRDGWRVRLGHLGWRLRTGWAPTIAGVLVGLVALYLVFGVKLPDGNTWGDITKNLSGLIGLIGSFFLLKSEVAFFNSHAAKRYVELARDPLGPLTRRYDALIGEIGRPVAVFVDDLDRCDAKFVVELLQNIQTLFRRARVLYVVAADRDWICSSYEQIYKSFSEPIAEPGRTLGHMFLEKMFQLSIEVPHLVHAQRDEFWDHLIGDQRETALEDREAIEVEITERLEEATTEEQIIDVVDEFRSDPARAAIAGARAFHRMQSKELVREREHFLTQYAHLLEPNPRAMKRLLNAYGFRRGFDIQSSNRSDPDALVRWTILENRWPVLADHLSGRSSGRTDPQHIEQLMRDPDVRAVAGNLTWELLHNVASAPGHAPSRQ